MQKIKIFVSYKYKKPILSNEIITPIQTGRAIAKESFEGMLGDDTGDNISAENDRYNELTAQYWVWKHYEEIGNPEYIGFMHYRRQFIFDEELKHLPITWLPNSEFYFVPKIYDGYINHFTKEKIEAHLKSAPDCITFKKYNVRPISKFSTSMKSHFSHCLLEQEERFYEAMEKVFENNFPEYNETFKNFTNGTEMFCCNSFIMKKDLFFEYNEFLFKVLDEVDKQIDSKEFSKAKARFLGYLGEYLQTIFLIQKQKDNNIKILELPATFVCKDYKNIQKQFLKSKLFSKITIGKARKHYQRKLIKMRKYLKTQ